MKASEFSVPHFYTFSHLPLVDGDRQTITVEMAGRGHIFRAMAECLDFLGLPRADKGADLKFVSCKKERAF